MKKIISLACGLLLSTVACASGLQFSNFYVFGDSLSDIGNHLAQNNGQPYTNKGALLWDQHLANDLDLHLRPSNQGGTDYANAGAESGVVSPMGSKPMLAQVAEFLAQHNYHVDSKGLYSIWIGGNDLPDAFAQNFMIPQSAITGTISNIIYAVNQLHNAGAKYIIVPNLPDLGKIPLAIEMNKLLPFFHITKQFTQASIAFNNQLLNRLNHIGFDVIQIDIIDMMKEIEQNPARFGFTNTTGYFKKNALLATTAATKVGSTNHKNPNHYLFWNDMHPSGMGHLILGDYAYSIIQGPVLASTMSVVPFSVTRQANATINSQVIRNYLFTVTKCHSYQWRTFFAGNYMPWTQTKIGTKSPALHVYNRSATAGVYRFISSHWFTGGSYQYSDATTNFHKHLGGFDLNSHLFSIFAGYQAAKAYVDAIANYDYLDFDNFHRIIPLGITNDVTYGSTHGRTYGVALQSGYWLISHPDFVMGPFVDVNYDDTTVDSLSERGYSAARQRYFTQHNDALFTNLGVKTNFITPLKTAKLITQVHLSYDRQWLDGQSSVGASTLSLPGSHYHIPVAMPEGGAANGGIAFSLVLHHCVTFTVSFNKLYGRHINRDNVGADVSIPF